jgi:hypothetical protein
VLGSSIVLVWVPPPQTDVVGYHVYRRNADGSWPPSPGTYQPAAPLQFDPDREPLKLNVYRVTAIDATGAESSSSNVSAAATGPVACTNVDPPLGIVTLDWPQPESVEGTHNVAFQAHVMGATSMKFYVGDPDGANEQLMGEDFATDPSDPTGYLLGAFVARQGYLRARAEANQDFNIGGQGSLHCTSSATAKFRIDDPPERPGSDNPCDSCDSIEAQLSDLTSGVSNHPNSSRTRYTAVKDDVRNSGCPAGCSMDTLKIVPDPAFPNGGGYVGVYHSLIGGAFQARVATSSDLRNWSFKRALTSAQASQPTITPDAPGTGFYVAYEKHGCSATGNTGGDCLVVDHYASIATLIGGMPDQTTGELPHAPLIVANGCEGTPNFYRVRTTALSIGFHYNGTCGSGQDREAMGLLTLPSPNTLSGATWAANQDRNVNSLMTTYANPSISPSIGGSIGDRDSIVFKGRAFSVIEAQATTDPGTWRTYLFDREDDTMFRLGAQSPGGSTAFQNPTLTQIKAPDGSGADAIVSTYFIPSQGAAAGEAGEMVMWKKFDSGGNCYWYPCNPAPEDPVIAAAGDISCPNNSGSFVNGDGTTTACGQGRTAGLIWDPALADVLTLGDNQYENGTLTQFNSVFDKTWGLVKPVITPSPGNHEYQTTSATDYFSYYNGQTGGVPNASGPAGDPSKGYYAYDLGNWRIIAVNTGGSNCGGSSGSTPGPACDAASPQVKFVRDELAAQPGSRCVLLYWHHPRFVGDISQPNSGHGPDANIQPLWDAMYNLTLTGQQNILSSQRADLVLNGHSHNYQRGERLSSAGAVDTIGIREIVAGTGGKDQSDYGILPSTQFPIVNGTTFGVLRLALHSNSYDWRFLPEAGSSFTDAGSDTCHS